MNQLKESIKSKFNLDFSHIVYYYQDNKDIYSIVFSDKINCLILDYNITKVLNNKVFSYAEYINQQNELMNNHQVLYRYFFKDDNSLAEALLCYDLMKYSDEGEFLYKGKFIDKRTVNNTPTEHYFEKCFENVYGANKLRSLEKEYNLSTFDGGNIFVDYVLDAGSMKYAIEENGVSYHHPQLIGEKRYIHQLNKQNMLAYYNFKVYRWSTEHLRFQEKVCDSIRYYFGDGSNFIDKTIVKEERKVLIKDIKEFDLYEHQKELLHDISTKRLSGVKAYLVVLPTATGKSQIGIEELRLLLSKDKDAKVLILSPTSALKKDWIERINQLKNQYIDLNFGDKIFNQICICSYRYMYNAKYNLENDYFDYIIFDEAHHAVAPECRKILEHFNPQFILGLTATPERLDKKRLEDVFGIFDSRFTLKEAIQKNIIVPIRAFRLESNINLKEIRFNGHDYVNADLEKYVRVESRNTLIATTLKKYFVNEKIRKQGIVFCVSVNHAKKMAEELTKLEIRAKAVYGNNPKNNEIYANYKNKEIDFLCSCDLITEGWDSPQTEVIVMARPTLSKVVYTQQLGRGLRKYEGKKALYVIDVVDQYGGLLVPWSVHGLFNINAYGPFEDILDSSRKTDEMIIIQGLFEEEIAMKEIDIFTFENKYGEYLSMEETARELFISTGTLRAWINKKEVIPSLEIKVGKTPYPMFNKDKIHEIRLLKGLKEHNDITIKDDFFDFLNEKQYTFSFKIIFMLSCIKLANSEGDVSLDKLLDLYRKFYIDRIKLNFTVDRPSCVYSKEYLLDNVNLKENMLSNPFEKYERKRFMYYSKDLNIISFNTKLWNSFSIDDKLNIKNVLVKHLNEYYEKMDKVQNIDYLL